jgi:hypothetical protein
VGWKFAASYSILAQMIIHTHNRVHCYSEEFSWKIDTSLFSLKFMHYHRHVSISFLFVLGGHVSEGAHKTKSFQSRGWSDLSRVLFRRLARGFSFSHVLWTKFKSDLRGRDQNSSFLHPDRHNSSQMSLGLTTSPPHHTAPNRQPNRIVVPQHMQELVPGILQAIYLGGRYLASLLIAPFFPLFKSAICHYSQRTLARLAFFCLYLF